MKALIHVGDVRDRLSTIPDNDVQCVVTSPPYWGLRDYGHEDQLGLEPTPDEYIDNMVEVFREVRRILKDDGVMWLNLGDSYAGNRTTGRNDADRKWRGTDVRTAIGNYGKPKDLMGIPWRVAFALQSDGWYLRQDVIWHKPNPLPESVRDRCTKAHEYLFMLTKNPRYYFDNDAIKEPAVTAGSRSKVAGKKYDSTDPLYRTKNGPEFIVPDMKNKRSVWSIPTKAFKGAHFAVMPEALVEPCILASSRPGDIVFDPFAGSGTVGVVALRHGRKFAGCELNSDYADIARARISNAHPTMTKFELFGEPS